MRKFALAALAAATAITGSMSSGIAAAQPDHHRDRDYRRDHDYNRNWDRWYNHDRWRGGVHYYGGRYGYNGYRGHWRTGQRYPYWRDNRYVIEDYRAYRLPPPRPGYRYYRDNDGDIVMAAIASGVIGLIIGSQINNY